MANQITNIWADRFKVATFQVGPDMHITISALFSLLQESAARHGINNGFGYYVYQPLNKQWIMTRISVEIGKLPYWEDELTITTWAKIVKRVFFARDFVITNKDGETMANATACYALIDRSTKKPEDINVILDNLAPVEGKEALHGLAAKVPVFEPEGTQNHVLTQYSQMDLNNHISNIKFIEWLLDQVPPDVQAGKKLQRIDVNYLSELFHHEKIAISSRSDDQQTFLVKIKREDDQSEICRNQNGLGLNP